MCKKADEWYDRQSTEKLIWIGLSPMILLAVALIAASLIWGR